MALVFDPFHIRTRAGEVLFEDILTLLGTAEYDEAAAWIATYWELVSRHEGFTFRCPDHSEQLDALYKSRTRKFNADVRAGRRENFPKEEEFQDSVRQERAVLEDFHRQDFRIQYFRLTIGGRFFGLWMNSSNKLLSHVDDLVELKTFPGPCMNNFESDPDEWHVVTGEIIVEFVRKLEFVTGERNPTTYRFTRIEFPDRVPLAGAFHVADVLTAGGLAVDFYPAQPSDPAGNRRLASAVEVGQPIRRRRIALREQ